MKKIKKDHINIQKITKIKDKNFYEYAKTIRPDRELNPQPSPNKSGTFPLHHEAKHQINYQKILYKRPKKSQKTKSKNKKRGDLILVACT